MSSHAELWTIGVEEEYQIIDPNTRALCSDVKPILSYVQSHYGVEAQAELQSSQIEISTPVCRALTEIRRHLQEARRAIIASAAAHKRWIAAAGTHPFSPWNEQQLTASVRYQEMQQRYQQLVREQVIFGYHVHIGYRDREQAIQVMNRVRGWLAPLLALTANSPYWLGEDTGYASYRTQVWGRWPMAGPPRHFASAADYDELKQVLIDTSSIQDSSHLYWDIRLSDRFPTMEFRVTDVCLTVNEAVMIAGLVRALVQTYHEHAQQGMPFPQVPIEVLRAANWRAARYGLDADLIDVMVGRAVPARELIMRLLEIVRPALEANGEWEEISSLVYMTLQQGTGANRQRAIYQRRESLQDVIDFIVDETAKGSETN